MWVLWMIVVLLFGLVLVLGYGVWNLLKKNEAHEDFDKELLTRVEDILQQIRSIDIRGSFEADDEVGIVYKGIRGMVMTLQRFLEIEE